MTVELHKGYVPGAIGRVAELHATYYQRIPGFGVFFESRVARELAQFCEAYDDDRDGLWLAHLDGGIEGAIAIDGTHAGKDGAHLRWFITSDKVRGTGIGRKLLASAVEFCRACHYDRIYLENLPGAGRGTPPVREIRVPTGASAVRDAVGRGGGRAGFELGLKLSSFVPEQETMRCANESSARAGRKLRRRMKVG